MAGPASRSVIRYWSSDLFTVELIALKLEPLKIDRVLCYVKFFQLNSSDTQSTPNKQFKKNFLKLLTFKKKFVFLIKFFKVELNCQMPPTWFELTTARPAAPPALLNRHEIPISRVFL